MTPHEQVAFNAGVELVRQKGRLLWARDSHNGHLHGQCETDGCLRWMQ